MVLVKVNGEATLSKLLYLPSEKRSDVQSNLNSSNPDGSFTMADSNLFLSPYEILPMLKKTNI